MLGIRIHLLLAGVITTTVVLGAATKSAQAQDYAIDWYTIDGGGATATGGAYELSGAIGQPDAGVMTGGGFEITGGFWALSSSSAPQPPTASAAGPRYLFVTAAPAPDPVAIRLVGHPDDPTVSCIDLYVQTDGTLDSVAVYLSSDAWGEVFVRGNDVVPEATYSLLVESTAGVVSSSVEATTWLWGDVDNNGVANLSDVQFIILGFQGDFSNATLEAMDLDPCVPNGVINLADAFAAVLAFQGVSFSEMGCVMPCGVE